MANCRNTQQLNITCGTDVVLHDRLVFDGETFDPALSVGIVANLVNSLGKRTQLALDVVDTELIIEIPWVDGRNAGCYGLEVRGSCNGRKWSTYADSLIRYTWATVEGPSEVEMEHDWYDVTQVVSYRYSDSPLDEVDATIDDNYGEPTVTPTYEHNKLTLDFKNLRGNGIASVEQTTESLEPEGVNETTITQDNGNTTVIRVRNGKSIVGPRGQTGDSAVFDPSTGNISEMKQGTGDDALSPMSQKAISDIILAESKLIDFDLYEITLAYINGSDVWATNASNNYCIIIPINAGKPYKVKASQNAAAIFALLKDDSHTAGDSLSEQYATGTSRIRIEAGEHTIVEAPSDANYMYIYLYGGGTNYTPAMVAELAGVKEYSKKVDVLADSAVESYDETYATYTKVTGKYLNNNGTTVSNNANYGYIQTYLSLALGDYESINIENLAIGNTNVAIFFYADDNSLVERVQVNGNYSIKSTSIPQGATKFRLNYKLSDGDPIISINRNVDASMYAVGGIIKHTSDIVDGHTIPINAIPYGISINLFGEKPEKGIYKVSADNPEWSDSTLQSNTVKFMPVFRDSQYANIGVPFRVYKGEQFHTFYLLIDNDDIANVSVTFRGDVGEVFNLSVQKVSMGNLLYDLAFVEEEANSLYRSVMVKMKVGDVLEYKVSAASESAYINAYSRAREDEDYLISSVEAESTGSVEGKWMAYQDCFVVITSTSSDCYARVYGDGDKMLYPHQVIFDYANIRTILSPSDEDASVYDNVRCQNGQIIAVDDSTYYMLYYALGTHEDNAPSICLAYSTDGGETWVRGIPNGIDAPYPGTNVLIKEGHIVGEFTHEVVNELAVCKVDDAEYPYRLFGMIRKYNTSTHKTEMTGASHWLFKSADLVNWTPIRKVLASAHDSFSSMFCENGLLKVYLRMWDYTQSDVSKRRLIGVMWMDINGNVVVPPSALFGNGLYVPAATMIGNNRELMLPSHFYVTNAAQNKGDSALESYIVEGESIRYCPTYGLQYLTNQNDGWRLVTGLVTLDNKQYCLYTQFDEKHGESNNTTDIRLCPVSWITYGTGNSGVE